MFVTAILIPDIVYAVKNKDGFENRCNNKTVLFLEQVGRYTCILFMCINIPGTWYGWASDEAFAIYLIADAGLALVYVIVFAVCFNRGGMFRAVTLSVIPSVIFLLSGILSRSVLLVLSSCIFGPAHIYISCRNERG